MNPHATNLYRMAPAITVHGSLEGKQITAAGDEIERLEKLAKELNELFEGQKTRSQELSAMAARYAEENGRLSKLTGRNTDPLFELTKAALTGIAGSPDTQSVDGGAKAAVLFAQATLAAYNAAKEKA